MKPWMYTVVGVVSLMAFVNVIAPDISFARSATASVLGLLALQCVPIGLIEYRERALQKRQAENDTT